MLHVTARVVSHVLLVINAGVGGGECRQVRVGVKAAHIQTCANIANEINKLAGREKHTEHFG